MSLVLKGLKQTALIIAGVMAALFAAIVATSFILLGSPTLIGAAMAADLGVTSEGLAFFVGVILAGWSFFQLCGGLVDGQPGWWKILTAPVLVAAALLGFALL